MRFAHVNHPGMLRAARHFDVFSLNCYAADPTEALLAVQKALDMPVLIGEFHFGALDAGSARSQPVPREGSKGPGRAPTPGI